jgi:hypothetical protein
MELGGSFEFPFLFNFASYGDVNVLEGLKGQVIPSQTHLYKVLAASGWQMYLTNGYTAKMILRA